MSRVFVISFYTHHQALVCFRTLQEREKIQNDIKAMLIPVPRELSSSCGTAVKVELQSCSSLLADVLKIAGEYECFCELVDGQYQKISSSQ